MKVNGKKNKNNERVSDYFIGIDGGTDSAGWAVTSCDYDLLKFKGKDMWGARLFDAAKTSQGRRIARTSRRRLQRRKARLNYLESLFNDEIAKIDPNFFRRLKESRLWMEDKTDKSCPYSLFNDKSYNDKDYLKDYPTIYHLRSELINNPEPHDVRLVYLAIHHIMKNRGNFLYALDDEVSTIKLSDSLNELTECLKDFSINFEPSNMEEFKKILISNETITDKKEQIVKAYGIISKQEDGELDLASFLQLLCGASVSLEKLFNDKNLKELKSISLGSNIEEKYDELSAALNEKMEIIYSAKSVFDVSSFERILGDCKYISDAKIKLYEKNKKDIALLRKYVEDNCAENLDLFFRKDGKLNIYKNSSDKQKEILDKFYTNAKNKLNGMKDSDNEDYRRIYKELEDKIFFIKLRSSENGVIPYQLYLAELKKILKNAENYLPFLKEKNDNEINLTISEKIINLFEFKIPYYVGPLNEDAKHTAVVRKESGKVTPWNFEEKVDKEQSAVKFMENLVGRCTYTGDLVLPMDSLLYSEYCVLNEINKLKINGVLIESQCKTKLFEDLFKKRKSTVTKKSIQEYLVSNGYIETNDEISGVDEKIKTTLKSYHDFKKIHSSLSNDEIEKIIERIIVFGDDKKMLKKWLKNSFSSLSEEDINQIAKLNYKKWGRLSKKLLSGFLSVDKQTGEAKTIIQMMRDTNYNLMELLSEKFDFSKMASDYKKDTYGVKENVNDLLSDMYISPSVRRSILQSLKLVDEIVDIQKSAPKKIFVEMARGGNGNEKTKSRKQKLLDLYKSCKKEIEQYNNDIKDQLNKETDVSLQNDKLYLYYIQLGRCMYTNGKIDLNNLLNQNSDYDIDHIIPKSKIYDDSIINNKCLVLKKANHIKSDNYPIDDKTREKMGSFWKYLLDKELISQEKYLRLVRNTELTEDELKSFINRQLVETRQSTKAFATILKLLYPNTKIVYSKAGNVTDFRRQFRIYKFRNINDFHHAKDAYLNIVVGNTWDTKFNSNFFSNFYRNDDNKYKYNLSKIFNFNVNNAWTAFDKDEFKKFEEIQKNTGEIKYDLLTGTIEKVYKNVFKNTPIITVAPYQQKGELFDLTILKKGSGQLEIKNNKKVKLDIKKYGGYNKITGTYFCLVEYTDKKKVVRGIKPVYLYKEKEFLKNPEEYCKDILKLQDPRVIIKKIPMKSLFESNGSRFMVTGRSNDRLDINGGIQLIIDDEHAKYYKNIEKKCSYFNNGTIKDVKEDNIVIGDDDGISIERNIEFYDWLAQHLCDKNIYKKYFIGTYKKLGNQLLDSKETFKSIDMKRQITVLYKILKYLNNTVSTCDLTNIGGQKKQYSQNINSKISDLGSLYFINQSITGLYEIKIDLLK